MRNGLLRLQAFLAGLVHALVGVPVTSFFLSDC